MVKWNIKDDRVTEKQFKRREYAIYEKGNPICMTLRNVDERLNELYDENKELKDKNSHLQETLAFRSNQLALMERLVDDLGSEEMARQMEEILND